MEKMNVVLASLVSLLLVVLILPAVARHNKGVLLRNIAVWLALFLSLGMIYKNFVAIPPEREMPAFLRGHHPDDMIPPGLRHSRIMRDEDRPAEPNKAEGDQAAPAPEPAGDKESVPEIKKDLPQLPPHVIPKFRENDVKPKVETPKGDETKTR